MNNFSHCENIVLGEITKQSVKILMLGMKNCVLVSIFSLIHGFNAMADHNEEVQRYKKFEESGKCTHYLIHSNNILYSCPTPCPLSCVTIWKANCWFNKFSRFSCCVSAMAWGNGDWRGVGCWPKGFPDTVETGMISSANWVVASWYHMRWLPTPQETADSTGMNMWKMRGS